jgi:hypothetical protein
MGTGEVVTADRTLSDAYVEKDLRIGSMFKNLSAFAALGAGGLIAVTPAFAAEYPVRWTTGGAVWSTEQEAFDTFVDSGEVTDRGLEGGLNRSGWTATEVRAGLAKSYTVDLRAVTRYLYSNPGVDFLKTATLNYYPYRSMGTTSVQALRSAIIKDSVDGSISSIGIMRALPTDFRLAEGPQAVGAEGRCKPQTAQCTSLLSWYVFLPARIQASQVPDPFLDK